MPEDVDLPPADVAELSYEQARDALIQVVDRLERGGSTLEESLSLWERGEALAARCEQWLIGAKARLDAARGVGEQGAARGVGEQGAARGVGEQSAADQPGAGG